MVKGGVLLVAALSAATWLAGCGGDRAAEGARECAEVLAVDEYDADATAIESLGEQEWQVHLHHRGRVVASCRWNGSEIVGDYAVISIGAPRE